MGLRRNPAALIAAVATVVALASAWHSGRGVWRHLGAQHTLYAGYSDVQREREPVAAIPLPTGIFQFYAAHVRRGDRVYFQVKPMGFSEFFDLPGIVSAAGRFSLLPAVQVTDLRDATVVVSWGADPSRLPVQYTGQAQYGPRQMFVSRIAGR